MFNLKNNSLVAIRGLFVAVFMFAVVDVLAQEVSNDEVKTQASNNTEKDSSSNDNNKAAQSKPKSEERVFKPSEEISEDSPVPFPVDI